MLDTSAMWPQEPHNLGQEMSSQALASLSNIVAALERENMINTKHLLKVIAAWVTIVYVVCFVGVALIPGVRPWFMQYALHMNIGMGENILTLTTFISGLVIWNVVAVLGAWLFAFLHNNIRH